MSDLFIEISRTSAPKAIEDQIKGSPPSATSRRAWA